MVSQRERFCDAVRLALTNSEIVWAPQTKRLGYQLGILTNQGRTFARERGFSSFLFEY